MDVLFIIYYTVLYFLLIFCFSLYSQILLNTFFCFFLIYTQDWYLYFFLFCFCSFFFWLFVLGFFVRRIFLFFHNSVLQISLITKKKCFLKFDLIFLCFICLYFFCKEFFSFTLLLFVNLFFLSFDFLLLTLASSWETRMRAEAKRSQLSQLGLHQTVIGNVGTQIENASL